MFKILSLGLVLLSFSTQAYVGSVSAATGGTGLAAVEASETPFNNPAALAHLKGYHFTAGFGAARQTNSGRAQDLAISLTDNMKDTVVPTAISYAQTTSKVDGNADEVMGKTFKLSFGNFLSPSFAFGLGITHQNDRLLTEQFSQTNVQTGILWAPNNSLGAALVFDNLIPASKGIPETYRLQQAVGLGASYNYKRFVRFKMDVTTPTEDLMKKPVLGAGVESYMNKWLIMRIGVQRNNEQEANLYSAGMGFTGPKFGLHYAYVNSPQNESLTRHSVDLAVPIW